MFRTPAFNAFVLCFLLSPLGNTLAQGPADPVLAKVNGQEITQADYQAVVGEQFAGKQEPPMRRLIVNDLVNRELVVQDAQRQGLDETPEFREIVERLKYNALFNFGLQKYYEKHPVTEEQLKGEYRKLESLKQYKIRHILVPEYNEAVAVINLLNQGQDFALVASQRSRDAMTSARGGELGWLVEQQMFEPVAAVVRTLKQGGITGQPVQTSAGWHIVQLQEVREIPPLPYEQVRGQLMAQIRDRLTADYLEGLRQEAKIEIKQTR